jgi:hypothetical protein
MLCSCLLTSSSNCCTDEDAASSFSCTPKQQTAPVLVTAEQLQRSSAHEGPEHKQGQSRVVVHTGP